MKILKSFSIAIMTSLMCLVIVSSSVAQESRVRWHRNVEPLKNISLFHSTQSINLPTAETLGHGEFEFEISHRFYPPTSSGIDALWGLDGPVNMRIALAYAPTNRLLITLGRSNLQDNIDLRFKYKIYQLRNHFMPVVAALQGGTAWNSQVVGRKKSDRANFQYYGQLILNTGFHKKFAFGVVPTYLYNSCIYCGNRQYSLTFGSYFQYYVSGWWSILFEWNPTVSGWRNRYNSFSFGVELETGGHFFKIILTNNATLNPTQFHAGADSPFSDGQWRIGFNITRLLKFSH